MQLGLVGPIEPKKKLARLLGAALLAVSCREEQAGFVDGRERLCRDSTQLRIVRRRQGPVYALAYGPHGQAAGAPSQPAARRLVKPSQA